MVLTVIALFSVAKDPFVALKAQFGEAIRLGAILLVAAVYVSLALYSQHMPTSKVVISFSCAAGRLEVYEPTGLLAFNF